MKGYLVLTADEAAKEIRTGQKTVLDKLESGEIPAYREGTHWKIPRKLLEQYVENKALSETRERRKIKENIQEDKSC